jgi:hypothetical protein
MAFNPFQKFRKHQKAMFAALTIACMFVFVLQSGYGSDAFTWLIRSLSGGSGPAQRGVVAKLYGSDVTEKQLAELASQRAMAQTFLSEAIQQAMQNRAAEVRKKMKEGHTGMNLPPQQEEMFLRQRLQMDDEMGRLQGEAINVMIRGGGRGGETKTLLDFMIWQQEAKRLGIYLTKNDVNALVGRITSNRLTPRDSGMIEKRMRADPRFKGMTSEQLIKAVGDEFQVQLAQLALTGGEQQFGAHVNTLAEPPAVPTPQQFWTYYRDQTSGIDVALLPFKVDDFLAEVKDKPTEKELKDLYDKYKDKEFDPKSGDPAFKRSRRIQVEWVSGKADSPFYRKEGLESFKTTQHVAALAALLGDAASGQALFLGTDAIMPRTLDMSIRAEYDSSRSFSYRNDKSWLERWGYIHDKFHPTYLYRPDSVAASVGAAAIGPVPVTVTAAKAAGALIGPAESRENNVRLRYQGTLLLSGASLSPLTTTAMAAAALATDEFVPYEFAKPEIEDRVYNRLARKALLGNLKIVQQEIEKLVKDKKEAEIPKYLAEAVKKYDLQTGKTTGLRGVHIDKIIDDPGLKAFKEAYLKPPSFDSTGKDFDKLFFTDKKPFEADLWPSQLEGGTAEQQFLFWKTENQDATKVPFDQVKADVEKAWRYQKAREMAKKAADKAADEAKKTGGDLKKLADLAAQQKTNVIEVGPIAQMHKKRSAAATVEFSYEGPHIDKSKVPNLDGDADREGFGPTQASTYGQGFASKLLPLRDKDKGSTVVVPDQTEGAYYLAVLVKQTEPSLTDFYEAYQNSATPPSDGSPMPKKSDPMFQNFLRQLQSQYREELMERLRKDAKLEILKPNVGRLGGGGQEEDF